MLHILEALTIRSLVQIHFDKSWVESIEVHSMHLKV